MPTFAGNAKVSGVGTVSGQESYQDHGPAQRMTVKSSSVLAVVCDGSRADLYGQATVDGAGAHPFRISVQDNGEPGYRDTYRILLDTGYDSGEHTLEGGNVQVRERQSLAR